MIKLYDIIAWYYVVPLQYEISPPNYLPLQWRHNECDGASNQWRLDCLLNRLFRRRSKKISKPRVTGLCEGNPPVTGGFPSQRASNAENVSIWWPHHHHRHNIASPQGERDTGCLLWGSILMYFPSKTPSYSVQYRMISNRAITKPGCTRFVAW